MHIEQRVLALEEKLSHLEYSYEQLNATVIELNRHNERLNQRLVDFLEQLAQANKAANTVKDELPPHY